MAIIYLYLLGFKTPVWPITIFGQSSVQPSEWFLVLPSRITDQRQSSVFPTRLHKKCNSRDRLLPILIHWNTKNSDPDRSWFAWRCCRWRQNGSELYQRPWKERVPQKIGDRKIHHPHCQINAVLKTAAWIEIEFIPALKWTSKYLDDWW